MNSLQDKHGRYTGQIMREREPVNHESPFDLLSDGSGDEDRCTSNELFYIRSHFKAPKLDVASYELKIEGSVETALSLSIAELKSFPVETRMATLECAGNGRVFLSPAVEGAQWQLGAVATSQWTGVLLSKLLDKAGMSPDAVELIFEGADRGNRKRSRYRQRRSRIRGAYRSRRRTTC